MRHFHFTAGYILNDFLNVVFLYHAYHWKKMYSFILINDIFLALFFLNMGIAIILYTIIIFIHNSSFRERSKQTFLVLV